MAVKILLVEPDAERRAERKIALQLAGYQIVATSEFHEARAAVHSDPQHLIVAAVRLGAFNGLHLVIESRVDHPETAAIITGDRDDLGLASDARRQGASYLVEPATTAELLTLVAQILPTIPT